MYKVGDRVEMVSMPDDPHPIPPGTQGTVDMVTEVSFAGGFTQIGVEWDNGRSLMVCIPPDRIRSV